jgi:hypothetical protein
MTDRDRDCTCRVTGNNGDPDQYIKLDKYCPVHGIDPDYAREDAHDRSFN